MKLEDLEAKLRRKLEEVERRKHRLRELEEEEERLLDELSKLGFPKGSIVARYVKCGKEGCRKCPHGPYYYLVWKDGGKTRWKYLGKVVDTMDVEKRKKAKAIVQRLKQIQREKKKLEQIDL
jgi:hypothetical protein